MSREEWESSHAQVQTFDIIATVTHTAKRDVLAGVRKMVFVV